MDIKSLKPYSQKVTQKPLNKKQKLILRRFIKNQNQLKIQNRKVKSIAIGNKYSINGIKYVLYKLIGEYIEIEIRDNCVKILKGIVHSINGFTLILKEQTCFHAISIDSIIILHASKDISIRYLYKPKVCNNFQLVIRNILCYLKNKEINISLDDKYMNIGYIKILEVGYGIVKVKEINVENPEIYILNYFDINLIENIPLEDDSI